MIDFLRGTLAVKDPTQVTIDVGGVGFTAAITVHAFDRLPDVGTDVTLLMHLHVREDALQLYGFIDAAERRMFRELMGITGIGARMAMTILTGSSAETLLAYVSSGDVAALTRIPGVGRKTAERIVLELRDKVQKQGLSTPPEGLSSVRDEALLALLALGYPRNVAEKAVAKAESELTPEQRTPSQLIRAALKQVAA